VSEFDNEGSQEERIAWLRDRGIEIELPADRKNKQAGTEPIPSTEETISITIVKIPCNDKEPYSEVKIPVLKKGKGKDELVDLLRIYFKDNTGISLGSIQDAASKQFTNQAVSISAQTLSSTETTVETFPLSHPNITNKQRRVSMYLDEAGQLKKLPSNSRASSIAAMCGFQNVPFVGDMFIARLIVGTKGVGNVDFFQSELDSSALWLKDIQKLNYDHGVQTNRVTMDPEKDAGLWDPDSTTGKDEAKGLTWAESDDSMEICITLPSEFKTIASKNVKVTFQTKHLTVKVQNTTEATIQDISPNAMLTLLDITLAGSIRPDECNWSIDKPKAGAPPKIEITVEKIGDKMWGKLVG
jgi:hypothetical protein